MDASYRPKNIETKVQALWQETQAFKAVMDKSKEKYYCLSMLPYPSGALHMGHVRNYTIGDVISRFQRMLGKNVLQPIGWDAFGMPAENAAIKNNIAPASWTLQNIEQMRKQLKSLGFAYDWDREVTTCLPEYYRWEQWYFTKLIEKGLAYKKAASVNWCPHDQTVLANEQVHDGCCWRCDTPVVKREMEQWFIRTTAYAEELLTDIDDKLQGWPEDVKAMQRNWIGRSQGVTIEFSFVDLDEAVKVYTTRPDTLFGATYLALSAQHPVVARLAEKNPALADFVAACNQTGTTEAELATTEKKGCATGLMAVHPLTGNNIPVWAANFVLMDYGTGAVMSVPGHDQRDWEFAKKYGLDIVQVIAPVPGASASCDLTQEAFTEKGHLINSGEFDGLSSSEAFTAIAEKLAAAGCGEVTTNYRLRDWGVSRQRYWGAPVPIVYQDGEAKAAESFPIELPVEVSFSGIASPLKNNSEFEETQWHGKPAMRETDTFDTFMESSWYYIRYCSPDFDRGMFDTDEANYWLPVDQYVGGIEHATMHLMYARLYYKTLRDEGMLSSDEPFTNLLCQGMVLAESWFKLSGKTKIWVNPEDVEPVTDAQGRILSGKQISTGEAVSYAGMAKMSKSKLNGKDPQRAIDQYGADTVRLFSMFAAPPEQTLDWSEAGVQGARKFIDRLWRAVHELVQQPASDCLDLDALDESDKGLRLKTHQTIAGVTTDFAERKTFNTAIAKIMELLNAVTRFDGQSRQRQAVVNEALSAIVLMLSPITPHVTQELWQALGGTGLIANERWPQTDQQALVKQSLLYVVQVNGKVRARLTVAADTARDELESLALSDAQVAKFVAGKIIKKVIVVPEKLINIVAS